MKVPLIRGLIDRRILLNYAIDAGVLARVLPEPFRPQLVAGRGIGGVCLIRLKAIRPRGVPASFGWSSENAAHRFAIEWDEGGERREGVYIPRRDTSSRLNTLVGGRFFPGVHHHARFTVSESLDRLAVALTSDDGSTSVAVAGRVTEDWPQGSVFRNVGEASRFFERGSVGYSATRRPGVFDGLELACRDWCVTPLAVENAHSSYFEDAARFPQGSLRFDNALLMRGIAHEWHSLPALSAAETLESVTVFG